LVNELNYNLAYGVWNDLELKSGWTGSARFKKNGVGIVVLAFNVVASAVGGVTWIGTLPVGYFPLQDICMYLRDNNGKVNGNSFYINATTGAITTALDSTFVTGNTYIGEVVYVNM
jgi:hypothetical protein